MKTFARLFILFSCGFLLIGPVIIYVALIFGMTLTKLFFPLTLAGVLLKIGFRYLSFVYYYPGEIVSRLVVGYGQYWHPIDKMQEGWFYYPDNLIAIFFFIIAYVVISLLLSWILTAYSKQKSGRARI